MVSRTSETADKRKHKMPHAPFEFLDIPYTPGSTLKAVGYKEEGRIIASQEVTTAGEPAQIQLVADYEGVDFVADGSKFNPCLRICSGSGWKPLSRDWK